MDIYCPVCGEPFAQDELHDVPNMTYANAARRFFQVGCTLFDTAHNPNPNTRLAALSRAVYSVLGNDIDGIASTMEDMEDFE